MKALILAALIGLAAALAALSIPAHAQTARRLWLLCSQEDPQCGPMLRAAERAYEADPTWSYCLASAAPPSRHCPSGGTYTQTVCRPTRNLSPEELFIWFMRIVPIESLIWEEPARIGVWEAMHNANACQSEAR